MPPVSRRQARLMFAAAAGKSDTVPSSVGKEFTEDAGDVSSLPEHVQAQRGHKAKGKTHRGRRSRGKGPKPENGAPPANNPAHGEPDHMHTANEQLQKAKDHPTKQGTLKHLFRALSTLKKAK